MNFIILKDFHYGALRAHANFIHENVIIFGIIIA